ncbi:uncharacterized protein LOC114351604 [Ostrinia furnacalis]|uniref:uncharacterized protein LOC114351604 n=1 Tax=Ostrinia furnacalis TaxID=93504 RepID=UPI00103DBEF3|nr:uncharacterized protein LOC114351604 [Ostrinia furnacalis]
MELRSRKVLRIESLPGGDRRGAPGADAGCLSMRTVGGEELSRRAPAGHEPEITTADSIDQQTESSSPTSSLFESLASSPTYRNSRSSSTSSMLLEDVVQKTSFVANSEPTSSSQKEHRLNAIKEEVAKEIEATESLEVTHERTGNSNNDTYIDTEATLTNSTLYTQDCTFNLAPPSTNIQLSTEQETQTEINNHSRAHVVEESEDSLVNQLADELQNTLTQYAEIEPEMRPKLPKLRECKKLYKLVNLFNMSILQKFVDPDSDILHLHTIIYCSAIVISKRLGYKININTPTPKKQITKPPWQIRLEKDITDLRADIGRLTQYINNNRSKKLVEKVEKILKNNKKHSTHENNNCTPHDVLDTLKQKLALKAHRLARYIKALNRKNDNKIFTTNEKGFYRSLGNNNINNSLENNGVPTEEEIRNYWADIWEREQDHNEGANWIKEEESKWESIQEMEFTDITREDIEIVTAKMKNWKAAGHNPSATKEYRDI